MSNTDYLALLITFLFAAYGLSAAVALGESLIDSFKLRIEHSRPPKLISLLPIGFLAAGLCSGSAVFNGIFSNNNTLSRAGLGIGLIATVVWGVLVLASRSGRSNHKLRNWTTSLCALLGPLGLSMAAIFCLSGREFYQSLLGVALMSSVVSGLLALALLYVRQTHGGRLAALSEITFSVWMLTLGCLVPLAAIHSRIISGKTALAAIAWLALVGLSLQLLKLIYKPHLNLWPFAIFLALVTPPLLMLSVRPYFISGRLTLSKALSPGLDSNHALLGALLLLPLVLLGLEQYLLKLSSKS